VVLKWYKGQLLHAFLLRVLPSGDDAAGHPMLSGHGHDELHLLSSMKTIDVQSSFNFIFKFLKQTENKKLISSFRAD
jgi:hypothetical protein